MVTAPYPSAVGIDVIEEHALALANLAAEAPLAAPVPTCPGWALADLVWHVAEVEDFWAYIVTNRPTGPESYPGLQRPDESAELAGVLRESCLALTTALADAHPTDPAWSWAPEPTVAFTCRFQSHEALIHRVDGELAAGRPSPVVAPELAADGIDVMVSIMCWSAPADVVAEPTGEVVGLRTTDTGDAWTLGLGRVEGADGHVAAPAEDEPGTVIAGPANDLDLWLWGRGPLTPLEIKGEAAAAGRLREVASLG